MGDAVQPVGLLCSDAKLVEYYVRLITNIKRFKLKAMWCPDAERSIQLAADNDVPSVSHTAYQLISRADTGTVIIVGHPSLNALFCVQAQASKKTVICMGAAALTNECANAMVEFSRRFATQLHVVYPLKYSSPLTTMRAAIAQLGAVQNVYVECSFEGRITAKERLCSDALTTLHKYGHELIDVVCCLCAHQQPTPIAVTRTEHSSLVDHFRLRELHTAHMQIAFGCVIATFRLTASSADTLSIRLATELATLELNANQLVLQRYDTGSSKVLWKGDGTVESMLREGAANAFNANHFLEGPSESALTYCISTSVLQ